MDKVENVTPFLAMIKHLTNVSEDDIDKAVRDCLQSVNDNGGKATLQLKFTFKRHKNFNDVIGVLADEPKLSLSKPTKTETMMFTNANNDLLIQRQEQQSLVLEEQPQANVRKLKHDQ